MISRTYHSPLPSERGRGWGLLKPYSLRAIHHYVHDVDAFIENDVCLCRDIGNRDGPVTIDVGVLDAGLIFIADDDVDE